MIHGTVKPVKGASWYIPFGGVCHEYAFWPLSRHRSRGRDFLSRIARCGHAVEVWTRLADGGHGDRLDSRSVVCDLLCSFGPCLVRRKMALGTGVWSGGCLRATLWSFRF